MDIKLNVTKLSGITLNVPRIIILFIIQFLGSGSLPLSIMETFSCIKAQRTSILCDIQLPFDF